MRAESYLLSVIIPFFNNEHFIVDSLHSLFDQMDDDTEAVIINDGSTDRSKSLVEQLLLEYPQVNATFITQENSGVSSARNMGLQHATGRYIAFLDGDDLLSSHFLKTLRPLLIADENDLIEFNYQKFTEQPPALSIAKDIHYKSRDFKNDGLACLTATFTHAMWHSWSRVYRKTLFDGEHFEYGRRYEDVILIPFLYFKTQRITHIDQTLYLYRDNNQGITRNIKPKDIDDLLYALNKMLDLAAANTADKALKQLAALMVANCFMEIKSMSKKVYGYYYYQPDALITLKKAAVLCQKTTIPHKIIWQMQYPQLDTLLSKFRYQVKKAKEPAPRANA